MQYNQQKTYNPLKSLYFALVHSHLVYGIQIWSVAPQKSLNQLNIFQKKCIRIITQSKYNSHTEPLFKSNWNPEAPGPNNIFQTFVYV